MCRELIYLLSVCLVLGVIPAGAARAELVGQWRFDEGAGAIAADTSGNGNDGTLEGDPTFVDGQFGYALAFEASRVAIPASDTLTDNLFLGSFTLVAWINPTRTGNTWQQIFRSIKTNGESNDTLFINNNGRLSWRGRVGRAWAGGMCETASGVVPADQWTHVAIVGDGTYFRIYVNGTLSRESAFQTTDGTNAQYYIGGDPSLSDEYYTGLIDDVRIYNHAMSRNNIRSAMESQGGAILKAYWPNPANGAIHLETWVSLGWTPGSTADSHDVYFGENVDDVEAGTGGTFRGNHASNDFLVGLPGCPYPDGLAPGTTYYWRVDEVEADGVTVHEGNVWRFSVSSGKATVVVIPKDGDWASSMKALQPGDIGQLEAGRYLGRTTITVSGAPDKPIIIRGAGYLESVFDGGSGNCALRLDSCSNLIIENITVTNPSPIGIDGRENYSAPARNRLPERDPGYSTLAEGIIIRGGASGITIRRSYFVDIATRGIFVSGGVDDLTVEHNIFLRISDDTAGGDVAVGSSATRMTVRENLMAGNVDGIVTDGAGAGHIFERNIIIFHRWEDGIDIKSTWKRKDEDPWTIVRNNVFYSRLNRYSAISIQFGTDYVKVLGNVFHGTGGCETILIRGRNGSDGVVGNVENHEIVGNWFDFKPGYNDGSDAFRIHQYTADPSDISNVYILHNVFTGGHRLGGMTHGNNLNVYNNIFESTTFSGVSAPDVAAGTNLYHDTAVWGMDTDPIVGEPVYTENPVGPLAEGSPGKGRATVLRGYDLGNDVGLPLSTENLAKLEISIIQSLEEHFLYEEIKEAMEQGGVSYDDEGDRLFDLWEKYYFGSPAVCDPNADPDNDGIANLKEYANGTDPLDPNSVP